MTSWVRYVKNLYLKKSKSQKIYIVLTVNTSYENIKQGKMLWKTDNKGQCLKEISFRINNNNYYYYIRNIKWIIKYYYAN